MGKISAHLVNMIKEGCQNSSALLILFIFFLKHSQKSNLLLDNKNFKWGEIVMVNGSMCSFLCACFVWLSAASGNPAS